MKLLTFITFALMTLGTAFGSSQKVLRHPQQGVSNQYIVVLDDKTPTSAVEGVARSLAASYSVEIQQIWPYSLKGFLANGPVANFEALTDDPRVKYAEQNAKGSLVAGGVSGMQWTVFNGQYLWNLDRLDELSWANRDSQLDMCTEGRAGYAYVIDTGIYTHSEFETPTRVVTSLDFSNGANGAVDTANGCFGQQTSYASNTHGTAVASVLAGTHIGAAKPQLISLRVFTCDMFVYTSDMIAALNWIGGPNNPYRSSPGVINQSGFVGIWDSYFQAYGDAVMNVVNNTNIPFFAAADNFATDACKFSPNDRAYTRVNHGGRVFVVGGTSVGAGSNDPNDYRWQEWNTDGTAKIGLEAGSNGGSCVSIYAPAKSTYVATNTGSTDYRLLDGTSFSSPLTAAIAVRWMVKQQAATGVIPSALQVYDFLLGQSQTVVQNTNTAPTYWACVASVGNGHFGFQSYTTNPGTCPMGYNVGPLTFPFATNTSDARMLYWDEGPCQ